MNKKLLKRALAAYKKHKSNKRVKKFDQMGIVDMGLHSKHRRFYVINVKTEKVLRQHHVAHGKNSDKNNDGFVESFSNRWMSKQTSKGMYVTGNIYKWGKKFHPTARLKLKLHGLDETNSNAYRRAVVIHASRYVSNDYIRRNGKCGRSWGCLAVDGAISDSLINQIHGGMLIYVDSMKIT